ncbi:MAG: BLUF domain-containing protein [Gammaproteobacteria bacterium]|nr:BLUF domain-containing protein [Gammaproteobacteria bacterium]
MKYIVYVSQAIKPFDNDELAQLLEHSRENNVKDGITGLLIYRFNSDFNRGNFVQVLEGSEQAIDDVWRRISNDDRHHTIVVIDEQSIETRMFEQWSMGFRNVQSAELKNIEGFSDLGSDEFWARTTAGDVPDALDLLKSFYDGG